MSRTRRWVTTFRAETRRGHFMGWERVDDRGAFEWETAADLLREWLAYARRRGELPEYGARVEITEQRLDDAGRIVSETRVDVATERGL